MEKFLDSLENAAYQLKDKGHQAVKKAGPVLQQGLDKAMGGAKAAYEKARPTLEDGLERTKEAYEKAKPVLRDGFERAVMKAADACERAAESLKKDSSGASDSAGETADVDAQPQDLQEDCAESLERDVEEQLEKIRAARQDSSIISDYVSKKYGKDDQ